MGWPCACVPYSAHSLAVCVSHFGNGNRCRPPSYASLPTHPMAQPDRWFGFLCPHGTCLTVWIAWPRRRVPLLLRT